MKKWFRKNQNEGHYQPIIQEDPEEIKLQREAELAEEERRRKKLETLLSPTQQAVEAIETTSSSEASKATGFQKKDPFAGAKFCSKDIFSRLVHAAEDKEHRVNCMTLLLFASGLAGYACQATLWEKQKEQEESLFLKVQEENKKTYLYDEALNSYLLEGKGSLWYLTSRVFQKRHPELSCPNIAEIDNHVMDNIGKENYSIFDISNPEQYIHHYHLMWNHEKEFIEKGCHSCNEWPMVYFMVLQYALQFSDEAINPVDALKFSMENAIFAARPDQSELNDIH